MPGDTPRLREVVEVEGEMPQTPPTGVTTFKLAVPVQLTPASVSVVPRAVFESQDAFVLGDALRNVSGVSVATGFGVFDFFTIRGFDSLSSALVLTDGAFEPESTFYPLYNVRQVEVVKGPAAFLYGANPLSGAVHLVRKQPMAGRSAMASVSYGSFDTYEVAGDGNLASADGSLAARFNGVFRDSDAYRDGRDSQLCAFNPALAWRPDDATRVVANLEFVRSRMNPDVGPSHRGRRRGRRPPHAVVPDAAGPLRAGHLSRPARRRARGQRRRCGCGARSTTPTSTGSPTARCWWASSRARWATWSAGRC